MRVTIDASTAHACNVAKAHFFIFVYVLIKFVVRNISYIAPNIGKYGKMI